MKNKKIMLSFLLTLTLLGCNGNSNGSEIISNTSNNEFSSELVSNEDFSSSNEDFISNENSSISSNIDSIFSDNSIYSEEVISSDNSSYSEELISSEDNISSEFISSSDNSIYSEDFASSEDFSSSEDYSSIDSESSSSTPEIIPLTVPSLIINEDNGVVSWNEVNNATHYNYIINDGELMTTTSTTLELLDRSTICVQAANNEMVSDWSYPVTYFDTSDIIINEPSEIYVYFHNTDYEPIKTYTGELVNKPNDPTKVNHTFDNWYKDPFHKEVFDFSKPLEDDTIIYANFIENSLIKDTYFWIKANSIISSTVSGNTSASGWNFIPLKLNESQTKYKEFYATISVFGASISSPAYFLIMDGFDDLPGRTYWKNNGSDFSITSDGIYNIYFSLETQYAANTHAKYELTNNSFLHNSNSLLPKTLSTPVVSVDMDNNLASWEEVNGAEEYEVMINNKTIQKISENYISLNKKEFITIRAISPSGNSSWSAPNANLNYVVGELNPITHAFVYFMDSSSPAIKVEIGSTINEVEANVKEDYTFEGWYEDIALTKKASFPYTVLKNTVFYPKYTYEFDYATKEYYQLVDSNGNKICGLTWNIDNFDFLEYETGSVTLNAYTSYYVKTLDGTKSWGPYKVSSTGRYKIYFSEDNIWNANTENASNVYIATDTLTIYFSNNKRWSGTINAYIWNDASGKYASSWPGSAMTYVKTNSYGEDIYKVEIDSSQYDYIIFNNGSSQSKDIPLSGITSGTGFYITDSSPYYGTYEFQ